MKFERFETGYPETSRILRPQPELKFYDDLVLEDLVGRFGGVTFRGGLYRVCDRRQVLELTDSICRSYADLGDKIKVFGYDWLGRLFAVDYRRLQDGEPQVLLLETGAGEAMQIPVTLSSFHNDELVDYANDSVAESFFVQWRQRDSSEIDYFDCVGYKVPLFLGGKDVVENLEAIDLDVYVEVCGQLRNMTILLDEGRSIRDVKFSD